MFAGFGIYAIRIDQRSMLNRMFSDLCGPSSRERPGMRQSEYRDSMPPLVDDMVLIGIEVL
jgi:hypothetical protein